MMKIVEQTSTHLILKDSVQSAWAVRLLCTPFLILGCLGIFVVISEKIFPSFFIIFCLFVGITGVFFTTVQTLILDKEKNQIIFTYQRLFRNKTETYPLNQLDLKVKETPFRVKTYSSLLIVKREPLYVVSLDINAGTKKIKLSGNYSMTRKKAVELSDLIRTFLRTSV